MPGRRPKYNVPLNADERRIVADWRKSGGATAATARKHALTRGELRSILVRAGIHKRRAENRQTPPPGGWPASLMGLRFERLTVRGKPGPDGKWLCRCVCKNWTTVTRQNLIGGGVRSCGCLLRENAAKSAPHAGTFSPRTGRKKKTT